MSFYSSPMGVQGRLPVGPDGNLITGTTTPNVGQFGWSTNDLKSVQDIVKWVSVAVDAAQAATAHSDYVSDAITHITAVKGEIDSNLTDSTNAIANANAAISKAQTDLTKVVTDAQTEFTNVKLYHDAAFNAMNFIKACYSNLQVKFPDLLPMPSVPVPANPNP